MKIMKTPAKAMKKVLDRKKSRTLVDKKEDTKKKKKKNDRFKKIAKAQNIKRAKQKEKKEKQFLHNQKKRKKQALDSGREHAPTAKSQARVLRIASTGLSMAKDAMKVSLEAKMEAEQAHKVSLETSAAQVQIMIQHDTRMQQMEGALHIGGFIGAEERAFMGSETPSPRRAGDCEKSAPSCETRPETPLNTYCAQVQRGRKLKDSQETANDK